MLLIVSGNLPPPAELPSFYRQQKRTALIPPVPPQLHPPLESLATTLPCSVMACSEVPPTPLPPIPSSTTFHSVSPTFPLPSKPSYAVPVVEQSAVVVPPENHAAPPAIAADIPVQQAVYSTPLPPPVFLPPQQPPAQMMIPINTQATEMKSELNDESKSMGVLSWFQQAVQQSEFLSKMANKARVS